MTKRIFKLGNVAKRAVTSPAGLKGLRNVAMIASLAGMTMFSGCDKNPNEDDPSGEDGIKVTGDVYTSADISGGLYAPYIPWEDDLKILVGDYERYTIGTGEIKKGKLTFTLTTPEGLQKMNEAYYHYVLFSYACAEYENFTYSDPNAKTEYMVLEGKELNKPRIIRKMNYFSTDTKITEIDEFYVYVDRDVTITATGKNYLNTTNENINLSLRKGWNLVYRKYVATWHPDRDNTEEMSFGMGSQGCNWVIYN